MVGATHKSEALLAFVPPQPLLSPSPKYSWSAPKLHPKTTFLPPASWNHRSAALHPKWKTPQREFTRSSRRAVLPLCMTAVEVTQVDASLEINQLRLVPGTTKCTYERDSVTETYYMLQPPSPTSLLVRDFKDVISQNVSLISLLTDLERAVDLMFLAYVGVAGQGIITADIGERQYTLQDLCAECQNTMTIFDDACASTLKSITLVFEHLLDGNEGAATTTLERCKRHSTTMAAQCTALAGQFQQLREDTNNDCRKAQEVLKTQRVEMQKLEDAQAELKANSAKQESIRDQLEKSIDDLQKDIDEETARQKTESEREFAVQMMHTVVAALAAGVGGSVGDSTSSESSSTKGAEKSPEKPDGKSTTPTKGAEKSPEKTDGKSTTPNGDGKVKMVNGDVDIRLKMIRQKRDEEAEKAKAVGTIAKLQAELAYNQTENEIAQSTITALQISIVAMDNIIKALNNAKFFWDNMTTYCEGLSSDPVLTYYEKFKNMNKMIRIDLYKSQIFVRKAIGYMIKWKALQCISQDYSAAANLCYEKSKKYIGTKFTVDSAKSLLNDLNSKVEASLDKQKKQIARHQRALEVQEKMLQTEKELLGRTSVTK